MKLSEIERFEREFGIKIDGDKALEAVRFRVKTRIWSSFIRIPIAILIGIVSTLFFAAVGGPLLGFVALVFSFVAVLAYTIMWYLDRKFWVMLLRSVEENNHRIGK